MKTLIALILFAGLTSFGQDTPGITNKVTEIDRDKDGKIDVRIETAYRGKTKVMTTMSRRNQQGKMTVSTRGYLADGKLVMVESDEDGNSSLESITVFKPDTDDYEIFTRQTNGTVWPVSTQKLDSIKRQHAVVNAAAKRALDKPEMTDKELEDLLEQSRQRIDAIKKEKEKNDGD